MADTRAKLEGESDNASYSNCQTIIFGSELPARYRFPINLGAGNRYAVGSLGTACRPVELSAARLDPDRRTPSGGSNEQLAEFQPGKGCGQAGSLRLTTAGRAHLSVVAHNAGQEARTRHTQAAGTRSYKTPCASCSSRSTVSVRFGLSMRTPNSTLLFSALQEKFALVTNRRW